MGIFTRLFGQNRRRDGITLDRDDSPAMLTIGGETYSGEAFDSPDGSWTVIIARGTANERHLFHLHRGDLQRVSTGERPESCAVANNGTVFAADWLSPDKEGLGGEVYAIDRDGAVIAQAHLDYNIGHPAITPDGRYAAFCTFQPDCHTYIIDLDADALAGKHEQLWGNKQGLAFRTFDETWALDVYDSRTAGPFYTLDLSGEIVWRSEKLQRMEEVESLRADGDIESLKRAIELLEDDYDSGPPSAEKARLGEELADTHWQLAREIQRDEGVTDDCWRHLNNALLYYFEVQPPSVGLRGVAKIYRLMGKYFDSEARTADADEMFSHIQDLEEQHGIKLLTDADRRRLTEIEERRRVDR